MSYKKAGFLNKLTRLSKRYEDYLQRQVVSKYLKFFFKLKPNFKKIYFNLNSQRMKFKINLYENNTFYYTIHIVIFLSERR